MLSRTVTGCILQETELDVTKKYYQFVNQMKLSGVILSVLKSSSDLGPQKRTKLPKKIIMVFISKIETAAKKSVEK